MIDSCDGAGPGARKPGIPAPAEHVFAEVRRDALLAAVSAFATRARLSTAADRPRCDPGLDGPLRSLQTRVIMPTQRVADAEPRKFDPGSWLVLATPALLRTVVAAALAGRPREVCLWLAGRRRSSYLELRTAFAPTAWSSSGSGFVVDPMALLDAEARLRGTGLETCGVFHSHPHGTAALSHHDRRFAYREHLQLVCGLGASCLDRLAAYAFDGLAWRRVPIGIAGSLPPPAQPGGTTDTRATNIEDGSGRSPVMTIVDRVAGALPRNTSAPFQRITTSRSRSTRRSSSRTESPPRD